MPITPLEQVQFAGETAWPTVNNTATAKAMLVTNAEIVPTVNSDVYEDRRGSLQPGFVAALTEVGGAATLEGEATYEDMGYYLDSMFSAATPTGAGPYVRAYAAPTTALATPKSRTIHKGQTGGIYALVGGLVEQLDLAGETSKPIHFNSKWLGTQVLTGTLAALSDRTVNPMMGDQALLYIDAWGGTMGSTAVSSLVWSWSLSIKTNRKFNKTLGSLRPVSWHDGDDKTKWSAQLKLSLELNATTKAYLDTLIAASPALLQRQVRIRYTTGASAIFDIDFAGVALKSPTIFQDKDGLITYDLTLDGMYNPALANFLKMTLTNSTAILV